MSKSVSIMVLNQYNDKGRYCRVHRGGAIRVAVRNGAMAAYELVCDDRAGVGGLKAPIAHVLVVRPCQALLYHGDVMLLGDLLALHCLHSRSTDLELRVDIAIFVPQ